MRRPASPSTTVLFEQEAPAHEDLHVVARTPGLDLIMRPGPSEHVSVQVVTTAPEVDDDAAQAILDRLQVSLEEKEETLAITTASPYQSRIGEWRAFPLPIQVHVHLPNNLDVDVQTAGGLLTIVGLKGNFSLSVNGGRARVEDIDGTLDVRSRASILRLRHVSGKHLSVDASVGTVEGQHLHAERIDLALRSCRATLDGLVGAMDISTSHGSVDLAVREGTLKLHGSRTPMTLSLDHPIPSVVHSAAADVDLFLNPSSAATLQIAGTRAVLADTLPFTGEQENGAIEGRLGEEGGPLVYVQSVPGTVSCGPTTSS